MISATPQDELPSSPTAPVREAGADVRGTAEQQS